MLGAVLLALLSVSCLAQAQAPGPGIDMVSAARAAALYPISNEEEQPLTQSTTLPVTCNMTLIGLPASSTPATSAAGRKLLASTNTSRGLETADIHCTGSYNLTIVGGPALETFASGWTGTLCIPVVDVCTLE